MAIPATALVNIIKSKIAYRSIAWADGDQLPMLKR